MKRISNKPLVVLVAFALVMGLVPFNALAEEDAIPSAGEAVVEQVAEVAEPAVEQPELRGEAKTDVEPAAADAIEATPQTDPTDELDGASLPAEGEQTTPAEEAAPEATPAEEEPAETEPVAQPEPAAKFAAIAKLAAAVESAAPKLTVQATTIDPVSITVTPPAAGSTLVDAQSVVSLPANAHYSLRDAYWVKGDSSSVIVDRYTDIEAGQQYALTIILRAENDYEFGGGYSVTGATAQDDGHMRVNNDPIYEYVEGEFVQVSSSEGWANVLVTPQAETVGLHVWSLGHGTINVNGSYYGTEHQGTWSEGAEVTVEALPADGYRFGRWWIKNASGAGRVVSDSTVTLVAGTDLEANVTFGLETASVTITPPAAGSTAATAPQVSVPSGAGYGLDTNSEFHNGPSARWVKSSNLYRMESLEASTTFEAGETYYAYVRLSDGADSFAAMAGGSTFNTDLQVSGGLKTDQGNFAATDPSNSTYMGIEAIIAVTIPETVTHTVAFDTHGAGTIPPQEVEDGGYATRPATPVKEGLHLLGWYEKPGPELTRDETYSDAFEFANTPITGDKTLHAVWYAGFYGATYDLSAATPKYADTGGDVSFTSTCQEKPHPSKVWWNYSNIQGSQITVTAIPAEGARFVGWAPATLDANQNMPDIPPSRDEIVSTDNPYTFTFEGKTALAALFEPEVPALTLHWSSPDGVDLVEPVVIDQVSNMTVAEALAAKGWTLTTDVFAKDGYQWSGYQVPRPITEYADIDGLVAAKVDGSTPVGKGLDIYYVMYKEIDAVEMTADAPTCGVETAMVGGEQTNAPSVTLASGGHYSAAFDQPAMWGTWETDHVVPFEGTFKGGESYSLLALLEAEFGYCFADDVTATVDGATGVQALTSGDEPLTVLGVSAQVTAEHVSGAAVSENVKGATCTKDGSHDEVVCCTACKEELSRKAVTDKALGHDWGAWKTVTEPTEKADGLRECACSRCDEVEEEVIPKLVVEYTVTSGEGATYTLGSGEVLTFTIKRSVKDETCFSHFTGVQVDGKTLSAKAYTAKAGSTIVTLNADYLETLKAGNHTLTALFDDGNGEATVSFAVAEKAEPAPTPTPDKKDEAKSTTSTSKGLPQTGDMFVPMGLVSLIVALVGVALMLVGRRIREQ